MSSQLYIDCETYSAKPPPATIIIPPPTIAPKFMVAKPVATKPTPKNEDPTTIIVLRKTTPVFANRCHIVLLLFSVQTFPISNSNGITIAAFPSIFPVLFKSLVNFSKLPYPNPAFIRISVVDFIIPNVPPPKMFNNTFLTWFSDGIVTEDFGTELSQSIKSDQRSLIQLYPSLSVYITGLVYLECSTCKLF